MKRSFALAVVLIILIVIPAYAQQAGLTLEQLAGRIDVLFAGQTYLTQRIVALETAVAIAQQQAIVVPTVTPIPPSPTPSQTHTPTPSPEPTVTATTEPSATPSATPSWTFTPSVTPTPTPVSARVTADRRLSLRRGPGNNHSIVVYVELNNQFEIIGRNLAGSWIQVNYNGKVGWLPARYADDVNTFPVVATPTPLPKPTIRPTKTPAPTPTLARMSDAEWELILTSVKNDMEGSGQNPEYETAEQLRIWVNERIPRVNTASKRCNLSIEELFEMMEPHALRLEEDGLAAEKEWWVRWSFLNILAEWEEGRTGSCNWYLEGYVEWLLDQDENK